MNDTIDTMKAQLELLNEQYGEYKHSLGRKFSVYSANIFEIEGNGRWETQENKRLAYILSLDEYKICIFRGNETLITKDHVEFKGDNPDVAVANAYRYYKDIQELEQYRIQAQSNE